MKKNSQNILKTLLKIVYLTLHSKQCLQVPSAEPSLKEGEARRCKLLQYKSWGLWMRMRIRDQEGRIKNWDQSSPSTPWHMSQAICSTELILQTRTGMYLLPDLACSFLCIIIVVIVLIIVVINITVVVTCRHFHHCHNHYKQPGCDHPANDLLVFPPTVAWNWLTHTGKENVKNAIAIIVMIVNCCSKLTDPHYEWELDRYLVVP